MALRTISAAALALCCCVRAAGSASASSAAAWPAPPAGSAPRQADRFHIGAAIGPGYQASSWFPGTVPTPEMWKLFASAVHDYAAANFTLIDGGPPMPAGPGQGVAPTNETARALATYLSLCKSNGLHAMPGPDWDGGTMTAAERDSVWGYGLGDEPGPVAFPGLANTSGQVRALRPSKPQFINLTPIYGCSHDAEGHYNQTWAPDATDCLTQYLLREWEHNRTITAILGLN